MSTSVARTLAAKYTGLAKSRGSTKPRDLTKSRGLIGMAVAGTWIAVLVLVAIPAWRQALDRHRQVQDLERQLADLDAWTVAGMWLTPAVAAQAPAVQDAWDRAFPDKRLKEDLFLQIARVADGTQVEAFELTELQVQEEGEQRSPLQDRLEAQLGGGGTIDGIPVEVPHIGLSTYRVKASFLADYDRLARFLGGLDRLDRALKIHNLVVKPDKGLIRAELELDVYVSQET